MIIKILIPLLFFISLNAQACGLEIEFIGMGNDQVTTLPANESKIFTFRVRNKSSTSCSSKRVSLYSYVGTTATGYGRKIGNSVTIPSTRPYSGSTAAGRALTTKYFTITDPKTPSYGKFTYKLKFNSSYDGRSNRNHRPEKIFEFSSLPDFVISYVGSSSNAGKEQVGRGYCGNKITIDVENIGGELGFDFNSDSVIVAISINGRFYAQPIWLRPSIYYKGGNAKGTASFENLRFPISDTAEMTMWVNSSTGNIFNLDESDYRDNGGSFVAGVSQCPS